MTTHGIINRPSDPLLPNPDKVVRIVATLAGYGKDMLYGGLWEAWRAREYP